MRAGYGVHMINSSFERHLKNVGEAFEAKGFVLFQQDFAGWLNSKSSWRRAQTISDSMLIALIGVHHATAMHLVCIFRALNLSCERQLREAWNPVLYGTGSIEEVQSPFVEYVTGFSDKTAFPWKSTGLFAYLVHVVLANLSSNYHCKLIGFEQLNFDSLLVRVRSDLEDRCRTQEERSSGYNFIGQNDVIA